MLLALAGIVIVLPVLQLIPLPPSLWQALPGRDLMVDALAQVDEAEGWRALSVAPFATLAALLALIPAVGTMLAVSTLDRKDQRFLIALIAGLALAGAALGVVQMASGPGSFKLYEISHDYWLTAFYANRNAAVDFLLIGMMALTVWLASVARRRPLVRSDTGIFAILQVFFLLAVVLTGSRAGFALLPLALLMQFAILRVAGVARKLSNGIAAVGGLVALAAAGALAFAGNARIGAVLARFDASGDARFDLWQDTLTAIENFWPVGAPGDPDAQGLAGVAAGLLGGLARKEPDGRAMDGKQ